MAVQKYLDMQPVYELERYRAEQDYAEQSVPFTGTPRRHPYDSEKVVLVPHPVERERVLFEFQLTDIMYVEQLSSVVTERGENLPVMKLWVRLGSRAVQLTPIVVGSEHATRTPEAMLEQQG